LNIDNKVAYLEFLNREHNFRHHTYDEEMLQYEYIKNGDMRALEASHNILHSNLGGHLSDHPFRNRQYQMICIITLVTRFAIEGGLNAEKAYNASDLFIQRIDKASSFETLSLIHDEMITYFVTQVASAKHSDIAKMQAFSKAVILCMDYISVHLHEHIALDTLAEEVHMNRCYLSALFKKETGMTITAYMTQKKMEAARNMLAYSDYSLSDIGEILNFSSYSHFARVFRAHEQMSPKEYRKLYFRQGTWK